MTVNDLFVLQDLKKLKRQLENKIADLRSTAAGMKTLASGVSGSTDGDYVSAIVQKIIEHEKTIAGLVDEITDMEREALEIIRQIDKPIYRALLIGRFINGKTVAAVAEGLGKEERWTFRLSERAIKIFSEIANRPC